MADWYKPYGPSSPEEIADALIRLFLEGAVVDRALVDERLGASKHPLRTRRKRVVAAGSAII